MRQLGDSNFQSSSQRNITFRAPLTPYGGAPVPRRRNKRHKDVCRLHSSENHNTEYQVGAGNNFDLSFFQGSHEHSDLGGGLGDDLDELSGEDGNLR
jgi:hypothetical protein